MPAFTNTQFMTSQEKELVLKNWEQFLKSGLHWTHFSDRLYKHLTLHCSFIAHYNRMGFHNTYFNIPEDSIRFLRQFDKSWGSASVEMGGTFWLDGDYADINRAMLDTAAKYLPALYQRLLETQEKEDISEARKLLDKHNLAYDIRKKGGADADDEQRA